MLQAKAHNQKDKTEQYPIVNTHHTFFSHLFVEEHLVGFHIFTTVNNSKIDSNLEWKERTLKSDLYMFKMLHCQDLFAIYL